MARRYDRGQFRKPIRQDEGFLMAEGLLTRVGVFGYREDDGTTRRELRLPEEVFHPDSLASLQAKPLTNGHPPEAVTARNSRRLSVGTIGTDARRDGEFIRGTVMVTDEATVAEVEAEEKQELSCGYDCRLDKSPGVHPTYGSYDAIQRDIRHNHVALVSVGRAGHEARLRLDAGDAVMVDAPPSPSNPTQARTDSMETITIRIDGIDIEVPKAFAGAIETAVSRRDAEIKALTEQVTEKTAKTDEIQAKLDTAEEKITAETARADAAEKPETLQAAIAARLDVERSAILVIGEEKAKELKLDSLILGDLKKAVIMHASPDTDLAEKSVDYIDARFDAIVESGPAKPKASTGLGDLRTRADEAGGEKRTDAKTAQAAMAERSRGHWDARDRVAAK